MWIDSHCHLDDPKLAGADGAGAAVARARAAGVEGMLTICCRTSDSFAGILDIARAHEHVWCSIGTHPHEAGDPAEQAISESDLVTRARAEPKIIGIGEAGLDYFYNHAAPEDQKAVFRKQLRAARQTDLPIIVHARDADADMIAMLREESGGGALRGVLHCFSSGRDLALAALDLGFYISFSGIVTFPKSEDLRAIARDIPLDRILVETDAPYLAPVPLRGKVNEPAYVIHTGRFLADFYGLGEDDFSTRTRENFFRLFNRARGTAT